MNTKTTLLQRRSELSPVKQALLEKRRRRESVGGMPARAAIMHEPQGAMNSPTSFAQQRFWFLQQLEPESSVYNEPIAFKLKGSLDIAALRRAAQEIMRRHEILCSMYAMIDRQVIQAVSQVPPENAVVRLIDLREAPAMEREAELARTMTWEVQRPFHLDQEIPWRMTLLRLGEEEHVVLIVMHHIITDAWSMEVFVRELATFYITFHTNQPSSLPEVPLQYADYARWQQQRFEKGSLDGQLAYWKRHLGGVLPVLELPTDRPRSAVSTHRGQKQSMVLPRSLSQALQALSLQEGVTLFMTLLATFKVLLHRYTEQEDILVGSPIANRGRPELEGLLGCFVNTLVLRTDLSGNPTFRELLQRVREVTMAAYEHQEVPFEKLVEELQPTRDLSHSALFQVLFVLQNVPLAAQELPGFTISPVEVECGTAKFDVMLCLQETSNGLRACLEYNSDLFEASTIGRMLGHFRRLLEAVVAHPDQRIASLPLLTEAEQRQLMAFNATRQAYPHDCCLHELVEFQVERTPDAIALCFEQQQVTYRQLNDRANALAYYLQTQGVGPEILVGVCMERSIELVVSLLATLKAGGAYVPLDPGYPRERLTFLVQDAQMLLLLTQERLRTRLPEQTGRVIAVDGEWDALAQESTSNPVSGVKPTHLAYLIYTSGSTGKPKGAMNSHRAICNRLLWMQDAYRLQSADHVLQKTPFSFDVSVWEFFWPLLTGAQLVLARPEGHRDSAYLVQLIKEKQITVLHFVPSMLRYFLEEREVSECDSLRLVICSGEALAYEVQQRFFERLSGVGLHNLYGPTEAAVDVTAWACECESESESERKIVPIGLPIANISIYVLDKQLNPVPIGVPGELHIGGVGVGRGYYNRPELTAEKFIPDPFSMESGARLYKTGDLVRYLPGGIIEYLGRNDAQIKIRGFRIELGEIETVLDRHPGVRECAVLAREDVPGNKRLVAYVVVEQEWLVSSEDLQHFVKETLPDYMVPAAFVFLEALPLSPNGKLDHRALPAPDAGRPLQEVPFVAPRDLIEEMLTDIWSDVLGVERVGIHDDFFVLGGHSLLATQVISRIRTTFEVALPLRTLFEVPTVADLVRHIKATQQGTQALSMPPLLPASRAEYLPLSFTQQRLWFFDQLEPSNPVYNISGAVRLQGVLQIKAVEQSIHEVVRRHEILRTTFVTVDGRPLQVIAPALTVPLPIVDLQALSGEEQDAEVLRLITEEMQRPFDLSRGPLLRVNLLKLAEEEYILMLSVHHIVSDGWSTSVFVRELTALYAACVNGISSPLPELPVQYADYALWQRDWLQGEVLETQLAYWKQQLEDLPALQLPTDYPRPVVQTFHGANQQIVLPRSLTAALRALSRREGVTLFMTLLATYQTLLFRYTDQTTFAVGIPIAGRTESKLEGLIGCFINTLALRSDLSGNPTFRELLGRVREVALGAYAHQDLPFEKLVEDLQSDRDLSRSPLFQVMFALQNVPRGQVDLPDLTLTHLRVDSEPALFDLDMTLWESEDEIVGVLNYNTDLFHEDTIKRMRDHFQRLLEDVVEDADQHLLDLPLLTEPEREHILVEWNTTQTAYSQESCFHRLFEAQVERTPEAVAVAWKTEQLTYQQLNRRANQVAHHLQDAGVGPESLVAVLAERGIPLLTSLVAIFKAGGAYLPLDPQHPASRLRYVLHHSGCRLVLTTSAFASLLSKVLEEMSPETRPQVLYIEDLLQQFHTQENLSVGTRARQLSYVIYTSGSTGKSKGVMVEQQGMLNHLYAKIEALQLSEHDRVAQTASQCFDISVWQFLAVLLVGGQVQIFPDEVSHDPAQLLAQVEEQRTSILETVPSLLRAMLDVLETSSTSRPKLEALRWLIPTGEALPAELCRYWLNLYPHIPLVNAYGPTECSDDVAHYFIFQAPIGTSRSVPIGRAIGNTQLYVLDRHMRPVPIGVHGELYVGGVGVGRGYLADAGRTAEAFIPDPFSQEQGMRLYRTGDMARYQMDGTLEFLGRRDFQVKLRGYRIELGEIEAVLSQHEGVRECVVLTREGIPGNSYLIAYVVPRLEQLSSNALRTFLKEQLPDYMVPSTFVYLEALPLTLTGKLDRHALPAPDVPSAYALDVPFVAPRNPCEEILAGIWAKLLGLAQEQISICDDFFALGGHSLLTVRLVAEIEKQFGLRLPLITIFQGRTIESLVGIIHQHTTSSTVEMQEPTVDLQAEAILDLDTCPELRSGELITEPCHLLLTGATGFLGNFLLVELLRQTSAHIYCLVRASSTEEAQQRLQGTLESAGLWQSAYRSRLTGIKGDLAQPLLGLSSEQFEELSDTLEVIYHNGAMVNMLYPYQELKAPNVLGTREVVRLAAHGRIKPLHYVSTLSVFSHIPALQDQPILEDELLDEHAQHLLGGYAQSKWVAEKLVTIARSRGLPVTIYRPGRISGHSQTGVWRTDDLICRTMKGCIQLGSVPALIAEERLELTPVDYVSQAIVALSQRKASSGQVFHLFNPVTISIGDLVDYANASGYRVQQVVYDAWADTLAETIESTPDNALAPLAPLFPRKGQAVQQDQGLQRTFGNQNVLDGLAGTSITCPPADSKLLSTYFAYLVQIGFLPAPLSPQVVNENER